MNFREVDESGAWRRRRIAASRRGSAGFSLVELLVVISVASILLTLGVSSYRYVTYSNRVSSEINGLLGDMQYARSEAVREGQPVSICPTNNGTSCDGTPPGSGWQEGWIVFSDLNGNGSVDANVDQVLHVQTKFTSQDTLVPSDTTVLWVTFNREGFTTSIPAAEAAAGVMFKLNTVPVNLQWERCLNIAWVGIMATQRNITSPTTCN